MPYATFWPSKDMSTKDAVFNITNGMNFFLQKKTSGTKNVREMRCTIVFLADFVEEKSNVSYTENLTTS